jgi:hypothetical protein
VRRGAQIIPADRARAGGAAIRTPSLPAVNLHADQCPDQGAGDSDGPAQQPVPFAPPGEHATPAQLDRQSQARDRPKADTQAGAEERIFAT